MQDTREVGSVVRMWVKFYDQNDDLFDPDAIALDVKEPDGTITTKAIGDLTKVDTGDYYYPWPVAQVGLHTYRYAGTASNYGLVNSRYFNGIDTI